MGEATADENRFRRRSTGRRRARYQRGPAASRRSSAVTPDRPGGRGRGAPRTERRGQVDAAAAWSPACSRPAAGHVRLGGQGRRAPSTGGRSRARSRSSRRASSGRRGSASARSWRWGGRRTRAAGCASAPEDRAAVDEALARCDLAAVERTAPSRPSAAASSGASPSPGPSRRRPACCSSTSPAPSSTSATASSCSELLVDLAAATASPASSRCTTSTPPRARRRTSCCCRERPRRRGGHARRGDDLRAAPRHLRRRRRRRRARRQRPPLLRPAQALLDENTPQNPERQRGDRDALHGLGRASVGASRPSPQRPPWQERAGGREPVADAPGSVVRVDAV